jgi:DNA-directed RNA polymerase subunit RPC12/RpoP
MVTARHERGADMKKEEWYCDRCGRNIPDEWLDTHGHIITTNDDEKLDLCQDCYDSLQTWWNKVIDEVKKVITPQPKMGRWIYREKSLDYVCSECGRPIETHRFENPYIRYPYCHCGAKMEESEGEE